MILDRGELYQQLILEHNKNPRNFGQPEHCTSNRAGHNPGCGDTICVYVTLVDDIIQDVKFAGTGCAISIASASVMTTLLMGKSTSEARGLFHKFHTLATEDNADNPNLEELDEMTIFAGVSQFPSRVKCATLAWHTLHAALEGSEEAVITASRA